MASNLSDSAEPLKDVDWPERGFDAAMRRTDSESPNYDRRRKRNRERKKQGAFDARRQKPKRQVCCRCRSLSSTSRSKDRSSGSSAFCDARFAPRQPPALTIIGLHPPLASSQSPLYFYFLILLVNYILFILVTINYVLLRLLQICHYTIFFLYLY